MYSTDMIVLQVHILYSMIASCVLCTTCSTKMFYGLLRQ
jgi:hypothetical protein